MTYDNFCLSSLIYSVYKNFRKPENIKCTGAYLNFSEHIKKKKYETNDNYTTAVYSKPILFEHSRDKMNILYTRVIFVSTKYYSVARYSFWIAFK